MAKTSIASETEAMAAKSGESQPANRNPGENTKWLSMKLTKPANQ